MKKEIIKFIGVIALLIGIIWVWYTFFPSLARFSWYVAVIILISVFGRDYKFFEKKK